MVFNRKTGFPQSRKIPLLAKLLMDYLQVHLSKISIIKFFAYGSQQSFIHPHHYLPRLAFFIFFSPAKRLLVTGSRRDRHGIIYC